MAEPAKYDPRYLEGIEHFNLREYFEAHEVWEELWLDCPSEDRLFHQSLIQAAVALYHWSRGNAKGARRLFHTGRAKMASYGPEHLGLPIGEFWLRMEAALAAVLHEDGESATGCLDVKLAPRIILGSIR